MGKAGGRGLAVLLVLGAAGLGAWALRDRLPFLAPRAAPITGVGPEAAQSAQDKLARLRQDGDTVHMSDVEFTSLVRYHLPGLAGPLHDPQVDFVDDVFRLSGRVPESELPDVPQLRSLREAGLVPDTAEVMVSGQLRPVDRGRVALRVSAASFARISLPRELKEQALQRFGRRDVPGLGPDEYLFSLPPGVHGARVENGELVLEAPPSR